MAFQSAVRLSGTALGAPGQAALPAGQAARMDAIACIQALEQELARSPISPAQKGMARIRLVKRAGLVLICSGVAVLAGGLAGVLSSL